MRNFAVSLILICLFFANGCDWFKGDRGKDGKNGIQGIVGPSGPGGPPGPTGKQLCFVDVIGECEGFGSIWHIRDENIVTAEAFINSYWIDVFVVKQSVKDQLWEVNGGKKFKKYADRVEDIYMLLDLTSDDHGNLTGELLEIKER